MRDAVLLNAAAGIAAYDTDCAGRPAAARPASAAMSRAAEAIDSGAAQAKLDAWLTATSR